ncbi:glycosyltransferase [Paeniroseomonas aquatica]|uniref:glycosyltransferase n=1 Tax=Paeniroseomonas aquatica TaxID=373043 RepID=UPI003605B9B4
MIVTVVTPTLNGIEYLAECIASVQRNRTRDIEIDHVIVDGGSTDGTVEMAEAAGLRVMTGKDSGIFDAINKGSFNSEGALLGFLGADDVMLEGAMAEVVRAWRDSGRRWVVGGIRWIDDRGRDLGELAAPPGWMTPGCTSASAGTRSCTWAPTSRATSSTSSAASTSPSATPATTTSSPGPWRSRPMPGSGGRSPASGGPGTTTARSTAPGRMPSGAGCWSASGRRARRSGASGAMR